MHLIYYKPCAGTKRGGKSVLVQHTTSRGGNGDRDGSLKIKKENRNNNVIQSESDRVTQRVSVSDDSGYATYTRDSRLVAAAVFSVLGETVYVRCNQSAAPDENIRVFELAVPNKSRGRARMMICSMRRTSFVRFGRYAFERGWKDGSL